MFIFSCQFTGTSEELEHHLHECKFEGLKVKLKATLLCAFVIQHANNVVMTFFWEKFQILINEATEKV